MDVEIENLADLDEALASGRSLRGLRLQDLDLRTRADQLLTRDDVEGLVVLGGRLPRDLELHLRAHGALVFPTDPKAPVDPYRARVYTPEELYAGLAERGYESTPDYLAYEWFRSGREHHDAFITLLRAIHDDSITDALTEFISGHRVVGVMGGHAIARGTAAYAEAAHLGHELASAGLVVATGGGPGAMEAANLGALCADPAGLERALADLGAVPSFVPSVQAWASLAFEVQARVVPRAEASSIGIPTWFYGHEPPNVFCHGIAKYFSNAIREDGLLARSTAGLVVLPGAAGTVQEVFQAVTPLFYAAEGVALPRLVLVGQEYWAKAVPVWAAVRALAAQRAMADVVHLVDSPQEAAAILTG